MARLTRIDREARGKRPGAGVWANEIRGSFVELVSLGVAREERAVVVADADREVILKRVSTAKFPVCKVRELLVNECAQLVIGQIKWLCGPCLRVVGHVFRLAPGEGNVANVRVPRGASYFTNLTVLPAILSPFAPSDCGPCLRSILSPDLYSTFAMIGTAMAMMIQRKMRRRTVSS